MKVRISRSVPYCRQCGRSFKYNHQLRKHRRVHSIMSRTSYRCKICNKPFLFLWKLRQHLAKHFNCKSGDNLYIDDLAIGVTIEPVCNSSCSWPPPGVSRGQKVPLKRPWESPDGQTCRCLRLDHYSSLGCDQMYNCGGYPHPSQRSYFLCSENCLWDVSTAASVNPLLETSYPRCKATHVINPEMVLHVDSAHSLSSVLEMREKSVAASSSENLGTMESDTGMSSDDNPFHIKSSFSAKFKETYLGRKTKFAGRYSSRQFETTENELLLNQAVVEGNRASSSNGSFEDNPETTEDMGVSESPGETDSQFYFEGVDEFDDMATFNDLSNFFPDVGESELGPQSREFDICLVDGQEGLCLDKTDDSGHASKVATLDPSAQAPVVGAFQKNDLNSSKNPTVIVSDLQKRPVTINEDKNNRKFYCTPCKVEFGNQVSLSNHLRSKKHQEGNSKPIVLEGPKQNENSRHSRHSRPRTRQFIQAEQSSTLKKSGKRMAPENKMTECKMKNSTSDKVLPGNMATYCEKVTPRSAKKGKRGPYRRATVEKLQIKCYICSKLYTTKGHFIQHARSHLKKLGYCKTRDDLFYCTICYAFYPRESDLKNHLVDKHVDDVQSDESPDPGEDDTLDEDNVQEGEQQPSQSHDVVMKTQDTDSALMESGSLDAYENRIQNRSGEQSPANVSNGARSEAPSLGSLNKGTCEKGLSSVIKPGLACMCHLCGMVFSDISLLSPHLKSHSGERVNSGEKMNTGEKMNSGETMNSEEKMNFEEKTNFQNKSRTRARCDECGRKFHNHTALLAHAVVHKQNRKKFKCPICCNELLWKQNFKSHLLGQHAAPEGQTFYSVNFCPRSKILCPFCDQVFIFETVDGYKNHMLHHVKVIIQSQEWEMKNSDEDDHDDAQGVLYRQEGYKAEHNIRSQGSPYQRYSTPRTLHSYDEHLDVDHGFNDRWKHVGEVRGVGSPTDVHQSSFTETTSSSEIEGPKMSPEGPPRGNSGLFMSPQWECESDSPDCASQGLLRNSYMGINSRPKWSARMPNSQELNTSFEWNESEQQNDKPIYRSVPKNSDRSFERSEVQEDVKRFSYTQTLPAGGNVMSERGSSIPRNTATPAYVGIDSAAEKPLTTKQERPLFENRIQSIDENHRQFFLTEERIKEVFDTSRDLANNFLTEGQSCPVCGLVILTQANVKQHLQEHFNEFGTFECVRKERKYECPLCNRQMGDRRSATAHLLSHWGVTLIRCPVCERPFNTMKAQQQHIKKFHPMSK